LDISPLIFVIQRINQNNDAFYSTVDGGRFLPSQE